MIRIVLADDHCLIRDGIRSIIKEEVDLEVAGEADHFNKLTKLLDENKADVALFDLQLPGNDGIDSIKAITERYPDVKILIFSSIEPENNILPLIEAGSRGFVMKNIGREELLFAIKSVASGKVFVSTDVSLKLLKKIKSSPIIKNENQKNPYGLTKRELEVLKLVAEGFTNSEIADKLFTSKRTIESHRQNLIDKTNAKNTASLIKYAIAEGIL